MTNDNAIVHENGNFWVSGADGQYTVYRAGITHSKADSSYAKTVDGMSIAVTRCNYLARKAADRGN
jgi:hypothetical protein